uniref:Uncharacterized protein n=1 Tax=Romanomermis culicivorax TaxID=13658 RepID=A0A915ISY1_ROMCU
MLSIVRKLIWHKTCLDFFSSPTSFSFSINGFFNQSRCESSNADCSTSGGACRHNNRPATKSLTMARAAREQSGRPLGLMRPRTKA